MKILYGDSSKDISIDRLINEHVNNLRIGGIFEVINMDLFWSGLIVRASEHKWNQRKSQFNKIFETAIQDTEMEEVLS